MYEKIHIFLNDKQNRDINWFKLLKDGGNKI